MEICNPKMGRSKSLSEVVRAQIIVLRQEGYTERDISKRLMCSKTAVHNSIVKFNQTGHTQRLQSQEGHGKLPPEMI